MARRAHLDGLLDGRIVAGVVLGARLLRRHRVLGLGALRGALLRGHAPVALASAAPLVALVGAARAVAALVLAALPALRPVATLGAVATLRTVAALGALAALSALGALPALEPLGPVGPLAALDTLAPLVALPRGAVPEAAAAAPAALAATTTTACVTESEGRTSAPGRGRGSRKRTPPSQTRSLGDAAASACPPLATRMRRRNTQVPRRRGDTQEVAGTQRSRLQAGPGHRPTPARGRYARAPCPPDRHHVLPTLRSCCELRAEEAPAR